MKSFLHPLSRFFVAAIFLVSGLGKLAHFNDVSGMMGKVGFPAPSLFLVGAIAFELLGAIGILLGFKTRVAAILLIVFLVPATIIFHVTGMADPAKMQDQLTQVLKNLAIIGALVRFYADGPGSMSIDERKTYRT